MVESLEEHWARFAAAGRMTMVHLLFFEERDFEELVLVVLLLVHPESTASCAAICEAVVLDIRVYAVILLA